MILLDGKKVAGKILHGLKKKVGTFTRPPGLAFLLIGENQASNAYVRMKKKACKEVGIASQDQQFPVDVTEKEILAHLDLLNRDKAVDGILIQQPFPPHLVASTLMEAVDPAKDVDGFHPINMGRLLLGEKRGFIPCTPLGIQRLLEAYGVTCAGKHVVIIGRSNIVGKPLGALLVQKNKEANSTVTLAHSLTPHLKKITKSADILVAAMGKPHFVNASFVRSGSVVVDVGINRVGEHIVGDVDFEQVAKVASHLTPVPGGIGPMTIAMLMENTILSYERRN
jgi:methylenetetrahydrofolate dehydrogenase (NADP+) / methenyltetrahydrofolate cyclohydrolase